MLNPPLEEEAWIWKWELVSQVSGWHKKKQFWWGVRRCAKWWRIKWEERCRCARRCKCNAKKQREERLIQLEEDRWTQIRKMETEIKICIQVKHFLKERREIAEKGIKGPNSRTEMIKKGSPLSPHNPFIDEDGLIRVGSR